MKALAFTLLFLFIASSEAKIFSRCELASVLNRKALNGYRGVSLGNWVCMASYESSFDTQVVGPPNSDGSRNYGIFQINSSWCDDNQGPTANGCNKPCSDFTNDDITDDIACVKRVVHDPNGMNAWYGWSDNCRGRDLSRWTQGCNL